MEEYLVAHSTNAAKGFRYHARFWPEPHSGSYSRFPFFPAYQSQMIGASLVEVMISLLILSMGLLGMAALQGLGTQYGNEAYFRSQAIAQTYDMFDRMRANPTAVVDGKYEQDPIPTAYATDCATNGCTTSDLANYDLVNWNQLNNELLPGGAGSVTRQGDAYTVRVTWQEDANDDGTAENQSFSLSARLW